MVAQVETITATDEGQGAFTKGEQERMLEFEKIVKFRDIITSGQHPRIKVPAHLLPANPGTVTVSARPSASRSNTAHDASAAQPTELDTSKSKQWPRNALAHQENDQQSAGMAAFPGLGLVPTEPAVMTIISIVGGCGRELAGTDGSHVRKVHVGEPSAPVQTQFSLRRAGLEKTLLEQGRLQSERDSQFKESLPGFDISDVWQKGLACERTFTPVPVMPLGSVANSRDTVAAAPASITAGSDRNDSLDDKTFYSSNFSTPEFGLTARIPVESGNDYVSMQDSSDYEPELDVVPSPAALTQPLRGRQDQGSGGSVQVPAMHSSGHTVSLPPIPFQGNSGPSNPTGLQQQWDAAQPGQAGGEPQQPPSPFVRAHNLSPVAPQPTHAAALAVEQLSSVLQSGQLENRGTPAQIAVLRREQAGHSSPDSSPQTAGSRATDSKRGSKRNNKRKADQTVALPNIKQEPRSPSPIVMPPAHRAPKRQRHTPRHGHEGSRVPVDQEHVVRGNFAVPLPPLRDDRVPVVHERAATERYVRAGGGAPRHADLQQEQRQMPRDWEAYDNQQPSSVPQYAQAARPPSGPPLSTRYVPEPSRTEMRPARAASQALVGVASGYLRPAPGGYSSVFDPGRTSVRPEPIILSRSRSPILHTRSPAMAPPPSRIQYQQHPPDLPPSLTRVVVDEYGREYYEPPRYAIRPPSGSGYDSEFVYERAAAPPLQQPVRAGSQMPLAYEDDRGVYHRTSPTFVQPRRVVQPEYTTYGQIGGTRQREYPVLAGSRLGEEYANERSPPPQPGPSQYERRYVEEPRNEYLIRASTVRPPEPVRYDEAQSGGYIESVGSIRPPDAIPLGHDLVRGSYDSRHREQPTVNAFVGVNEPVTRAYSIRPEQQQQQQQQPPQQAVAQRAYSVRPVPTPYFVEQAEGGLIPGYVYPSGARRDVYR